jgi:5-methylthioadenosine/S-adenosylhomocysteine deaminase
MAYLLKNGQVVLEQDGRFLVSQEDVLLRGDIIAGLGPNSVAVPGDEPLDVVDASNMLILPGLINSHNHPQASLQRGMFRPAPLEMWLVYVFAAGPRLSARELYIASLLDAVEKVKTGTTASLGFIGGELPSEEVLNAHFEACRDAGVRTTAVASLSNVDYLGSLPWAQEMLPLELGRLKKLGSQSDYNECFDICENVYQRWHGGASGRLRFGLGPVAPYRCTDEFLERIADWSARHNVIVHTHLLETVTQIMAAREICARHGGSMIRQLKAVGLLNSRVSLAHGIWLNQEEIQLVAEHGPWVVHNPVANLSLGDGIAPTRQYAEAGVRLALGSDGCSAAGSVNMLVDLHLAAVLQSMAAQTGGAVDWLDEEHVLRIATQGGAGVLQLADQLGKIEVGQKADLILLDLSDFPFIPLNDPLRQLVFGGTRARVDTVFIDGQLVLKNGRMVTVNEVEVYREANEIAARIRKDLPAAMKRAEEAALAVARICQRSLAQTNQLVLGRPTMRFNLQ